MTRLPVLRGLLVLFAALPAFGQSPAPVTVDVRFPDLEKHTTSVRVTIPANGTDAVEWMMPIWSPGFYRVENYAGKLRDLTAAGPDGTALAVEQPQKYRWKVKTGGAASVTVSYTLDCTGRSVTTNWVGPDYAVLNGPATFLCPVGGEKRPFEVSLTLPDGWTKSATGLDPTPDGKAHSYRAPDYDTLVDSPIAAGKIAVTSFDVEGSTIYLAAFGDTTAWDGAKVAPDVEKIVRENRRLWGELPFKRYVFLVACRGGGGGLEHLNSTLVSTNAAALRTPRGYLSWLGFVSHEYVHAFNVKRLRPVELGPFDYEKEPITASLWIAEGLTSYYGDLGVARAGLDTPEGYLARLSGKITQLQNAPGRLLQSLEQSSKEVWTNSTSGVGANSKTVSYYVKGEVAGFLLDAKIRSATGGQQSLDDVMRLAYKRYSGAKGFTPDEFRKCGEEVAKADLAGWYKSVIASPGEVNYVEALDWFGLRFAETEQMGNRKPWKLEIRPDASAEQNKHFQDWLRP
jgi:predicted metalloprotease with PDZ domain